MNLKQKLGKELREYALVSIYLFVCFSVLLYYRSAFSQASGPAYLPLTMALGKALIMGKFLMIGTAVGVGTRGANRPVIVRIAKRSILLWLLLIILTIVEELLVGRVHGEPFSTVIFNSEHRSISEVIASSLVMLLILIPYIGVAEVARVLGPSQLGRLLSEVHDDHRPDSPKD